MATYRVTWVIDIEADSAIDAAVDALDIQLDPQSIAKQFDVQDVDTGETESVDFNSDEWNER